ncbi:MAG: RNA polymerase factor sigma-54 [Acidobacteria bacterium]|nr:RNA polymerase factor sigma-54 [Acidobacteriota bacterium]
MPQLEQRLQVRQVQKLVITPQLQQAIKLLQLSKLELQDEIGQELVENPALEEAGTTEDNATVAETAQREVTAGEGADRSDEDFDYGAFFRDLEDSYEPVRGTREYPTEELPTIEQVLSRQDHLADHLTWQLEMSSLTGVDRAIGEAIIGNLDERGYLEATPEELAAMAPEGQQWTPEQVERVRRTVQEFDPVGVASRNLQECLLVQLDIAGLGDSPAATAIRDHLPLLESRRHDDLAAALKLNDDEFDQVMEIIRHLDPSPGEKYNPRPTTYIAPDVFVVKDGDEYRIVLNEEGLPRLRVSPAYRRFFEQARNREGDQSAREFVREKVRAAFRLIRSLEERQRTIYKVAASIVRFQRPFLDRGIDCIRPMVLREVAEDIGMHESTVSRVVNNKYMHTPRGLFEMRFFFHSGLAAADGESISSLTVKEKIRRMVAEEDTRRPLSDQAIAEALRRDGLQIARRTVAKYREELRIAPSTQRKVSPRSSPR